MELILLAIAIIVAIGAAIVLMAVITMAYHLLSGVLPMLALLVVAVGLLFGFSVAVSGAVKAWKRVYGSVSGGTK